jgi:hypothetical protein
MQTSWGRSTQLNYNQPMAPPISSENQPSASSFQSFAPLLMLAARAHCRPEHLQRLAKACSALSGWRGLVEYAEEQGLAPLFECYSKEAGLELPSELRIQLQGLALRHRWANQQLSAHLSQILAACQQAGIEVLLLKGAALFHLVYCEPGHRPMRDLDLLTSPQQARKLYSLLQELGYGNDSVEAPGPLHHLPTLHKADGGLLISVEVHFSLYHASWHVRPPREELSSEPRPFDFLGQTAYTLGLEDMLWHVYQHAVNGPLRLVSLADLVSLAEHFVGQIDWEKTRRIYPEVLAALGLIHPHAPLDDQLLQCARIAGSQRVIPLGAGLQGWPMKSLAEGRAMGKRRFLQATFLPEEWLLAFYYGIKNGRLLPIYRWVIHPFNILRIAWVRLALRTRGYPSYLAMLPD